jgi:hypothetical protein
MTAAQPSHPDDPLPQETESLVSMLTYGLSLPERTARSAAAIVGGLIHESAAHIIPAAFRTSRSYSVFIQQALDIVRHDIGGVERAASATSENPEQEAQLAQKAVSGLLDVAGAATMHLSPMTVLAIFNDIAYGSGHFLGKLGKELRREGIIDAESSIDNVSDLLESLEDTTSAAVDALEKPPINVEGIRTVIAQITEQVGRIDPTQILPQQEVARMWQEMENEAAAAGTSVWDVSAAMTMFAMNRITLSSRGALSTVVVAGNLFDQHILQHYQASLTAIHEDGFYATLTTASQPYFEAVWLNFDHDRETWTEDFLSGKLFNRAIDSIRGWFG